MKKQPNLFNIKRAETTFFNDSCAQRVWAARNDDGIETNFYVETSTEDPDGKRTLDDMFNADDYIQALLTGFRIANAGYEGIHIEMEDWK